MKKRTIAREFAFYLLYQHDMIGLSTNEVKMTFWHGANTVVPRVDDGGEEEAKDAFLGMNDELRAEIRTFAEELFDRAVTNQDSTDDIIRNFLKKGWTFERLGTMERTVLRLAISELIDGDAPVFAIFDDYVTLARRYTDDEKAAGLVNGLLERVRTTYDVVR